MKRECPKVSAIPSFVMGFVMFFFPLGNGKFCNDFYKVNPNCQWKKILVTIMGFVDTFGQCCKFMACPTFKKYSLHCCNIQVTYKSFFSCRVQEKNIGIYSTLEGCIQKFL